jgi:hypothetical protein
MPSKALLDATIENLPLGLDCPPEGRSVFTLKFNGVDSTEYSDYGYKE